MFKNVTNSPYLQMQEKLREQGYPAPQPNFSQEVAPNLGKWSVPQPFTFAGLVNMVNRTFRYTFDEAMRESPANARAMRRDPVLMDALRSRQIPVCQLEQHLDPLDETDPVQMYAAANVSNIIKQIPRFHWMKMQLLEATWYGRYGVQTIIKPDFSLKYKRWVVRDHRPMNGDKLVFKWSGDAGVLVHPLYDGPTEIGDRGLTHFFTPEERSTVIIHHFEPEDADFYDFDMAGAVEGVGVRSRLFYFWFLKSQILRYLLDFMQRIGLGIDAFFYEAGNPQSLAEMRMAAQNTMGSLRLLLPRNKDGTGPGYTHYEASPAGANLFIEMMSGYFDTVMRRYILGQSLTTEAGATGMGSGVAEAHMSTQEMLISYDATALAETLTEELVKPLYALNHPGVPHAKMVFEVDKPNVAEVMEAAQALFEMGVPLDGDDLLSITGMSKPQEGHSIVTKFQQSQASTVGVPAGTPVQSAADGSQGDPNQQQQYARSARQLTSAAKFRRLGPKGYDYVPYFGNDGQDSVIARPVQPIIRTKQLHKAMDMLLARRHNSASGRRSWSTVG